MCPSSFGILHDFFFWVCILMLSYLHIMSYVVSAVHGLSVSEYLLIAGQIFNQNVFELRGDFNEY